MVRSYILFAFLFILFLVTGCERRDSDPAQMQTIIDNSIEQVNELPEKPSLDIQSKPQQEKTVLGNLADERTVGIKLRYASPINDRVIYVDRNVTSLYFHKVFILGIEGLCQLESLDTIAFNGVFELYDFSFLTQIPRLRRLFIAITTQTKIDWGFVEHLPYLETLSVFAYSQPAINIDLKNNNRLMYLGLTSGDLEVFPVLFNLPESLRYLNLEGNRITSLPYDFNRFGHVTVIMSLNPVTKDETIQPNVTTEFAWRVVGHEFNMPDRVPWISDVDN